MLGKEKAEMYLDAGVTIEEAKTLLEKEGHRAVIDGNRLYISSPIGEQIDQSGFLSSILANEYRYLPFVEWPI